MVKITENKLRLIAKKNGIKDYQNMSKEKLISTLDKLKRITRNLLKNGLKKIVKMQNLSLNELEQIKRMNNFSENKLKQMAKIRSIKKCEDMSKEDLLIALFKSNQSHAELRKCEDNDEEIHKTKKIFNELRNNFSRKEIHNIRRNFYFKKRIPEYLKELEKEGILTEQEKKKRSLKT